MKKYFIKYILEFFVIVTGISISFWINEWDNNRLNRDKELYFLKGLKSDLEKQLNSLNEFNTFSNKTIKYGASILEYYSKYKTLSKADSLNFKLSRLMYSKSYPDINTTFNELKSTGQFNLFKETFMASKIIKYYQDSETYGKRLTKNTDLVYYNEIFPIIKSSIIIDPNNFGYENEKINLLEIDKSVKTILNTSEKEFDLVNAISLRIVVAKTNQSYIQIMINEAKSLLDTLNNELDKH